MGTGSGCDKVSPSMHHRVQSLLESFVYADSLARLLNTWQSIAHTLRQIDLYALIPIADLLL
jgi:hypothetical protein